MDGRSRICSCSLTRLMQSGFSNNWGRRGFCPAPRSAPTHGIFKGIHLPALLLQPVWVEADISQESSSLRSPLQKASDSSFEGAHACQTREFCSAPRSCSSREQRGKSVLMETGGKATAAKAPGRAQDLSIQTLWAVPVSVRCD